MRIFSAIIIKTSLCAAALLAFAACAESEATDIMPVELAEPPELIIERPDIPEPEPEPEPALDPVLTFVPYFLPETDPAGMNYRYDVRADGESMDDYRFPGEIRFGLPGGYAAVPGVVTFRGNNFRNSAAWGCTEISEGTLSTLYQMRIGSIDTWGGVGWTGQPAIVQWPADVRALMNIYPEKRDKDGLVEVICGALDGRIYFFDLDDGAPTRDPIILGAPIKGAVTVDPRGYPILYVGQGVQHGSRFGYYIYSLADGSELYHLNGLDGFAYRRWGAFDANPLFDADNDTMFLCAENGIIYTIRLNTEYDVATGAVSIAPYITRYRYAVSRTRTYGIESSPAAFSHYLFTADNDGVVQCVDLMTLEPVWARHCTDDTDASVVLDWDEEARTLSLYVACEVDAQGSSGFGYIRKLNAENGELLWEVSYPCLYDADVNGGILATPLPGQGDLAEYVFVFAAKVRGTGGGGILACLDKQTGEAVWERTMPSYGWSTPVAVYTEDGTGYLVVCDSVGNMYLIRGATGETLNRINLGGNIEASPAVYGSRLVVGTRGMRIYGIEIR